GTHSDHLSSFFFNETPTTETYTLSLHAALPISAFVVERPAADVPRRISGRGDRHRGETPWVVGIVIAVVARHAVRPVARLQAARSEEHTSELQSRENLVCRLLLEKKKTQ